MPGISFQKIVSYCELLSSTLRAQLTELPHMQPESESLDELIEEVKDLDQEQQELRGRLKEVTRRRQEAEIRSRDLRSRIVAQLQGKLGFTNENLLAFGITPRKRTRRRPAPPEPELPPPPTEDAPPSLPAQLATPIPGEPPTQ